MNQIIPKGRLLIIGGAEDKGDEKPEIAEHNPKYVEMEILKQLVAGKSRNPRIEVITTASNEPEKQKRKYEEAFERVGYKNVGFLNIQSKEEARDEKFAARIKKAKTVLFAGGDQFKIATILGGTMIAETIKNKYFEDKDFTVAGTSAGAAVAPEVMIQSGGTYEALFESDLKTGGGLGLMDGCIIDTHFIKRGRFGRLAQAIVRNPGQMGIGLGEDTAIIIKKGCEAKCLGSGMVVIIDGRDIEHTNINEVKNDGAIYVDNLRVHLLVKDCKFNIRTYKLEYPKLREET
ncbi:MAG: cyanophycinase [Fluviicola sp.]|jgi:cyanophycinase|uniref:cyanophycinase n=1 Tax=Fluviicola sp. TaxID=1917219 RepID=UPI0026094D2A|nr:cyanophycinase [Fluviicola sp.]MDF3027240.1 cyanophycinase [Fluviicola sp.]